MELAVPMFKPLLEAEEQEACRSALELGWLGVGSYVGEFERRLAELCGGGRAVVALATGHAAIHLALLRMGVGPGDEVITPSFNNIADLQAIRAVGAEPVFCDIDDATLCIDPAAAAALVGPRTRAIIAMDYACHFCDHAAIASLAERHGLRVLHDAAHSFGSRWRGRTVGGFSDMTMFSFDPVKNITTIDGGALAVRDPADVEWLREARLIGMGQPSAVMYQNQRAWTYDVTHLGFRYHLANLHAALGLAQLDKLERIGATRRATAARYHAALAGLPWLGLPRTDFADVIPFIYYVRVPAARRQAFREHLREAGVDSGLHWQPGHGFTFFRDCRRGPLPVTAAVTSEIVSVPLHSAMERGAEDRVIDAIRSFPA